LTCLKKATSTSAVLLSKKNIRSSAPLEKLQDRGKKSQQIKTTTPEE
jgi:hypothetical protein